ncbi:MAG: hypothetical protein MI723_08815 [Caulobacterales bacterium]|nr:hypothetical protein [Caulobacterales bacterium]
MPVRSLAAAAAALAGALCAAAEEAPPRAALESLCRDDGHGPELCACYGGFLAENFTERELSAAAAVFSSPALADDRSEPPDTAVEWFDMLTKLNEEVAGLGVSQGELITVFVRVLELRADAMAQCEPPAE